jgi:hypothetical protein
MPQRVTPSALVGEPARPGGTLEMTPCTALEDLWI